ncbi:MAG: branched-chain amino acid aminotransferase [Rickettsiales bacterium]|jgi:branched-chain amino acid aminotransferase
MTLIPFDDRDGFIWFNGKMVAWRDAKVHVLTHGLHYGSCVFEGVRVYNGKIFKLREHTERLINSGKLLGFDLPYSLEELENATKQTIAKQNVVNGYIRPVAWRGSEMMAISAQKTTIHVAIASWEWPSYFSKEARERGLRLQISKWARPAPNSAPTASKAAGLYMICTLSKHAAENDGFDDALMLDYRGLLSEATGANLFLVIDGKIHTPTPDCFLDGITRRTVIDLARVRGIEVIERQIKPEELKNAQEIFLTGTAAEVTPVGQIGEQKFTVGNITKQLMADYSAKVLE